jgi:hypothetical protein
MNRAHYRIAILLAVVALLPLGMLAQEESPGVNQGNYNIKQSFEFGGRFADFTGNHATYRTFVNMFDGPRLLEHSLEMRTLSHQGWLFDNFFVNSFGYGGDPNAVTRLRMYKNKWYNFSGTFRMARNQWDYNLLANPLNPPNALAAFPLDTSTTFSLHKMETVRRMSDFNLTLAPQSMFRVRLGYNRNIMEGPSLNTFHEGTDVLTFQDWKTTVNAFSVGVDFRGIPRTNISFDQFLTYYKGDTTWDNTPGVSQLGVPRFASVIDPTPALPNSGDEFPADLGVIYNSAISPASSRQPCQTPINNATVTPPIANPACNVYLGYGRIGRVRTDFPTSQISFQSSYFRNVDLSGRLVYSWGETETPSYEEAYAGLVTRTRQQAFAIDGESSTQRISVTADLGVTFYLNDHLRIVDSFRFNHFRLPGFTMFDEASLFPSTSTISVLTPSASFPTTTPQHATSSPADFLTEEFSRFLGQDSQYNQVDFLYDITRRVGVRVGYRYYFREITERIGEGAEYLFYPTNAARGACSGMPAGCTLNADGSVSGIFDLDFEPDFVEEFIEHTGLFGVWARPTDNLRVSFDMQLMSSNGAFTRISPRQRQVYKIRSTYRPNSWLDLSGSINLLQQQNNVDGIFHKQHTRTYGMAAMLYPNARFAFDFGYDFNDLESNTLICFTLGGAPSTLSACPTPTSAQALTADSVYDSNTHFVYFNVMAKPWKWLTTRLGYALTSSDGVALDLNPNPSVVILSAPPGPLRYNFHRPFGGIDLDLSRGFVFKTLWNHYGYNEKAIADITTGPRDFRGNTVTLSIRYAF